MKKNYLIILLGLALASCSDTPTPIDDQKQEISKEEPKNEDQIERPFDASKWKPYRPIYLNEIEKSVNMQQTDFSLNFYKAAQKEMANQNFVVSPYSVATALSMLANGAGGKTAVELQNVLLGEGTELSDLNAYNKRIAAAIDTLEGYTTLEIVNGIFPDKKMTLANPFVDNIKNFYDASVLPLNFNNLAECNPILNKWVDDATHGLIKNMSVSAYTPLLIANTLYFKSSWEHAFDIDETVDAPFYNFDNTVSTVKLMEGGNFSYIFDGEFAILSRIFGNGSFKMYIAYNYDDKENSLNGIENILTKENIKKYLLNGRSGAGTIKLPRFEVSIPDISIGNLLQEVGLKDLFGAKPDLSKLFVDENDIFRPVVRHECVLKVDETGTEGAAKTNIILTSCDLDDTTVRPEPKSFIVDHPFVFWIAEKSTGTMLFMGQINKLESVNE
ncbi:MAG: serpin family protein [Muribaculaceae bacterium]|nr:serpin family protein [Muribaculaceae bacterium]